MAADPAFLFYSSDFFMGTFSMTDAQVGQYIRLMCLQHQQGRLNEDVIKSITGGKLDPVIMSKFIKDENGMYYNKRLDEEVKRRKRYSESRRRNRQSKTSDEDVNDTCADSDEDVNDTCADSDEDVNDTCEDDAEDINNISQSYVNHMSNTSKSYVQHMETETETVIVNGVGTENRTAKRQSMLDMFVRFWEAYPRKVAKQPARKAFEKLKPDEKLLSLMLTGLEKYKQSGQWTRDGGRYIPYPATWLNQRRWEDELTSDDTKSEEVIMWATS